jgi:tetratricopeptide (TPR) repeat protein
MNAIARAHTELYIDPANMAAFDARLTAYQVAKKNEPKLQAVLGLILHQIGLSEHARAAYTNALMVAPGDTDTWLNLGVLYQSGGFLDESLRCFKTALKQRPDYVAAWANRAKVERALGDVAAAIASFRQAVRFDPRDPTLWLDLAMCELLAGDFPAGWLDYEARLFIPADTPILPMRFPVWRGEPLSGRRVLAVSEQGLGDVFQFVRYVDDLKALGAEVVLYVPPTLLPVLREGLPACDCIDRLATDAVFDFEIPLMSLPLKLAASMVSPPLREPYLVADATRVAHWASRIDDGTTSFKVGIAWQGNPDFADDAQRSIPLDFFAAVADLPQVRLINLQAKTGLDQLDGLTFCVEQLGNELDTQGAFIDTAAILGSIDLVITSDTAVAHLAGALGRPVWLALAHMPDWRWGMTGEATHWYPTMRLFRQQFPGDWSGTFAAIRRALADRLAARVSD